MTGPRTNVLLEQRLVQNTIEEGPHVEVFAAGKGGEGGASEDTLGILLAPVITAPAINAVGVAVAAGLDIVTDEAATDVNHLLYDHFATQIQVRSKVTGAIVFESPEVGPVENLTVEVVPALVAATAYEVRARHLSAENVWTNWSAWQTFTTA